MVNTLRSSYSCGLEERFHQTEKNTDILAAIWRKDSRQIARQNSPEELDPSLSVLSQQNPKNGVSYIAPI